MKLTVNTFHKDTEETDQVDLEIAHIERDNESWITLYSEELHGKTFYIVLDQEILERLYRLDDNVEPPLPNMKCETCGGEGTPGQEPCKDCW